MRSLGKAGGRPLEGGLRRARSEIDKSLNALFRKRLARIVARRSSQVALKKRAIENPAPKARPRTPEYAGVPLS